jgi:hypothetical protein
MFELASCILFSSCEEDRNQTEKVDKTLIWKEDQLLIN